MGYRLLGWAVWNLRLRSVLRRMVRRSVPAAIAAVALGGLAYAQSRKR